MKAFSKIILLVITLIITTNYQVVAALDKINCPANIIIPKHPEIPSIIRTIKHRPTIIPIQYIIPAPWPTRIPAPRPMKKP